MLCTLKSIFSDEAKQAPFTTLLLVMNLPIVRVVYFTKHTLTNTV